MEILSQLYVNGEAWNGKKSAMLPKEADKLEGEAREFVKCDKTDSAFCTWKLKTAPRYADHMH